MKLHRIVSSRSTYCCRLVKLPGWTARSHGKAGASDEGGGGLIAVCWATSKTPPPRPRMYAAESDPAKALVAAALLAASVASAFVGVKAEHA